jgi:hypothetical protein
MFGTVFRLVPKSGQKQAIVDYLEGSQAERPMGSVKGFIKSYMYDTGNDMWAAVIFESEKAYRDNAADPSQDKWYRGLRELLQSDPEWHDGAIISTYPS